MEIQENVNLKSLNTFGITVDAKYFAEVASIAELRHAIAFSQQKQLPVFILGGGSNVLFLKNFPGLVVKIGLKGITRIKESHEHVLFKVAAGEVWDDFVRYCVERGYAGLENLSLIPGSAGASPIQNIGAYGVEIRELFVELEYFRFNDGQIIKFNDEACQFGYRNSIFKNELKGSGVVLSVTFKLNKTPVFKTGYGSIREELKKMDVKILSIQAIREAVIRIRKSKLPDPSEIGNAGSFFKNPSVDPEKFEELIKRFPDLVSFPQSDGTIKLAAGWLIDRCGWRDYRKGDAGVHKNQALVLVNHQSASGREIFELSEKVKSSVLEKYGIELEREVNIV